MNTTDHHSFGGVWTRIKLEALGKYIAAFNLALSKQNFTRIYIDAFAGTGRCEIKVAGGKKSIEGSARRALATEPGFHKFYFIESRLAGGGIAMLFAVMCFTITWNGVVNRRWTLWWRSA